MNLNDFITKLLDEECGDAKGKCKKCGGALDKNGKCKKCGTESK